MDALKWLIFEEYKNTNCRDIWHLATCPHCNAGVGIQRKDVRNDYTTTCPHCNEKYILQMFYDFTKLLIMSLVQAEFWAI